MRHLGKIIKITEEIARIQIAKSPECIKCKACDMFDTKGPVEISAQNQIQAKLGELVEVEIAPAQVIRSSLIIFLFPLLGLMLGYWIGSVLAPRLGLSGEGGGILGAVILLVFSFLMIYSYDRFYVKDRQPKAVVIGLAQPQ